MYGRKWINTCESMYHHRYTVWCMMQYPPPLNHPPVSDTATLQANNQFWRISTYVAVATFGTNRNGVSRSSATVPATSLWHSAWTTFSSNLRKKGEQPKVRIFCILILNFFFYELGICFFFNIYGYLQYILHRFTDLRI